MIWISYIFIAALSGAFVTVILKLGLCKIDPVISACIQTAVMTVALGMTALATKDVKNALLNIDKRCFGFILIAGIAGGLSWLYFFKALELGKASIVGTTYYVSAFLLTLLLSSVILSEPLTLRMAAGSLLMIAGITLIGLR